MSSRLVDGRLCLWSRTRPIFRSSQGVVVGAIIYFSGGGNTTQQQAEVGDITTQEIEVGTEISAAAQTPAEKLPETNPYSGYKNPFE